MIYDLSMDDRVMDDLPNERLVTECLLISSATMLKKRARSELRSTFVNFDSDILVFVVILGRMCFSD